MKGKPSPSRRPARGLSQAAAEEIAAEALELIAADPDSLSRFLALTGIAGGDVRHAASEPGFLPAVMDHVTGDEELLLRLAADMGRPPEALAEAARILSPEAGDPT